MTNASENRQMPTGVEGLDAALHGGVMRGTNTLIVGTPGSGKTMLALQFLVSGILDADEPGLMISFEEQPAKLRAVARRLGLADDSAKAVNLHFLDGRPILDAIPGGAYDIGGLIAIVRGEVKKLGIRRIAFDGIDALFALGAEAQVTNLEFRRLVDQTDDGDLTTLICLKPSLKNDDLPRQFDLVEYMANAVIRLGYHVTGGLLQRLLRIVKVRGAGFAAGEHPFIITAGGLHVSCAPAIKTIPILSSDRVSTGVAQLDAMLEGGILRSSATLISGLPGTAKSTLSATFLAAGLARGERCMLVSLDEPAAQLIANVRSVGVDIEPYLQAGLLSTISLNAGAAIADEHYLTIERAVNAFEPSLLVVDPVSAFENSGGLDVSRPVTERLTWLVKTRGIAAMFTAVANSQLGEIETATGHVSAIADSWIHLSFAVKGGERNRTLTIVKSRGTAHSNQLREMLLTADGISLRDVSQIQGDFLLGTARLEREHELKREMHMRALSMKQLLRGLDERKEMVIAKVRDAERELLELNERMAASVEDSDLVATAAMLDRTELMTLREGRQLA